MALLPITLIPDTVLREQAKPVAEVNDEIRQLLNDMLETMYHAPGIGLAANQIGRLDRVIVMDCNDKEATSPSPALGPYKMINPEIIWSSEEQKAYQEGCLSIPEALGEVERPSEVKLTYLDEQGVLQELHATGLLAICVQHEIDHLNGILFIDYLSKLKRDMIQRKVKKYRKEHGL